MRKLALVGLVTLLAGCTGRSTNDWMAQLRAKDSAERLHAIRALGERRSDAALVVPALSEALHDRDPFIRRDAAHALARLGPDARDAAPVLRPLLKDRNRQVQRAASEALKKISAEG